MAQPHCDLSLTDDRTLYAGVLGSPGQRLFGAATVYAAPQGTLSLQTPHGIHPSAPVKWVPPHPSPELRAFFERVELRPAWAGDALPGRSTCVSFLGGPLKSCSRVRPLGTAATTLQPVDATEFGKLAHEL